MASLLPSYENQFCYSQFAQIEILNNIYELIILTHASQTASKKWLYRKYQYIA